MGPEHEKALIRLIDKIQWVAEKHISNTWLKIVYVMMGVGNF